MKRSIEKLRVEYGNTPFLEEEADADPLQQFLFWLDQAIEADVFEPNGMILATVSGTSRPSARAVLLKKVAKGGFYFYTRYTSRKGEQLGREGQASLTFWWKELFRQVLIEGETHKVSRQQSTSYFYQRPKGAQLAALVSQQSQPLASYDDLLSAYKEAQKTYKQKKVPCPPEWGGYCLIPDRMEFWQGRQNRLHDRLLYVKTEEQGWLRTRLAP